MTAKTTQQTARARLIKNRLSYAEGSQVGVDCESFAQKFFETAKTLIAGDNVLTLYYHADNNTRPSKARTKSDQMRSISLH